LEIVDGTYGTPEDRFTEAPETPLDAALHALEEYFANSEAWQLRAMARGLMRGYDAHWKRSQRAIQLQECEGIYTSDLVNIDSQRRSRTFSLAGMIDKLAIREGYLTLFDHKTTSLDISDPAAPYWRQLSVESQPSHYELLLLMNGIRVDRVEWDVIRKPTIRPKGLNKAALGEVTSLGTYLGHKVTPETIQHVLHVEASENAELYELRVADACWTEPDRYFQRRGVTRTNDELGEYARELWQISLEIRETRNHNRHFKNSGACMLYGSPCQFLGICSGLDSEDSSNWTRRENVHAELDGLDCDGRDALTNSRLRCYQTCRRKHYYQYELGLSRVEEEERESLFFGSAFHRALDAWWSAF
jgi:hypothetical protein